MDFIKNDCANARDLILSNVIGVNRAINISGREMIYSLSPGEGSTPEKVESVRSLATMYRITDDVWDTWARMLQHITPDVVQLYKYIASPNGQFDLPSFPDMDMLPFGRIHEGSGGSGGRMCNLTADEQYTMITYWAIWRSPLIYGGDLRYPDPFSLSLIVNADLLTVVDHSINNGPVNGLSPDIWHADHEDWHTNGLHYLTFHNWAEDSSSKTVTISQVTPNNSTACQVRDVWADRELGSMTSVKVTLRPHASGFYVLHDCSNQLNHMHQRNFATMR